MEATTQEVQAMLVALLSRAPQLERRMTTVTTQAAAVARATQVVMIKLRLRKLPPNLLLSTVRR